MLGRGTRERRDLVGAKLIVAEVFYGTDTSGSFTTFALRFVGMPNSFGWDSRAFRKIVLTETGADRVVSKRVPVRPKVDA